MDTQQRRPLGPGPTSTSSFLPDRWPAAQDLPPLQSPEDRLEDLRDTVDRVIELADRWQAADPQDPRTAELWQALRG